MAEQKKNTENSMSDSRPNMTVSPSKTKGNRKGDARGKKKPTL